MSGLDRQQPAPNFQLPSHRGTDVTLRHYRHRQPLVLVFTHSASCIHCRHYLEDLADSYPNFRFWQAEILVILPDPLPVARDLAQTLGLPFPVLADVDGKVRAQYVGAIDPDGKKPAIFVLDRFGAPETWDISAEANELMRPAEVLEWVQLGEMACPECGVSEWPV